jgi:hypothetical protein
MTVDETGQSLIVLVPSCKDDRDIKTYELEENRCKVGSILVTTDAGTVTLNKAFEATFVASANNMPTAPTVINTVESKISNNLILLAPPEITQAIREQARSKRDREADEAEAEAQRQIAQRAREADESIERARLLLLEEYLGRAGCNPSTAVCVAWEKSDSPDIESRGRGVAYRTNIDHYAEVKTSGYNSNTFVSISHDDQYAFTVIGSGDPGGNVVNIVQKTGVLRRP